MGRSGFGRGLILAPWDVYADTITATETTTAITVSDGPPWTTGTFSGTGTRTITGTRSFTLTASRSGSLTVTTLMTATITGCTGIGTTTAVTVGTATAPTTASPTVVSGTMTINLDGGQSWSASSTYTRPWTPTLSSLTSLGTQTVVFTFTQYMDPFDPPPMTVTTFSYTTEASSTSYTRLVTFGGSRAPRIDRIELA